MSHSHSISSQHGWSSSYYYIKCAWVWLSCQCCFIWQANQARLLLDPEISLQDLQVPTMTLLLLRPHLQVNMNSSSSYDFYLYSNKIWHWPTKRRQWRGIKLPVVDPQKQNWRRVWWWLVNEHLFLSSALWIDHTWWYDWWWHWEEMSQEEVVARA